MKLLFSVLLGVGCLSAAAQTGCPSPFDKDDSFLRRFHFTVGGGVTDLKGTLRENEKLGHGIVGKADYQIIRGLYAGVEGQFGALRAESTDGTKFVKNNYIAAGLNFAIHPLEMLVGDYFSNRILQEGVNSIYVGAGVKAVRNKYDMDESQNLEVTNYRDANGTWMFPTINAGVAVPINKLDYKKNKFFSIVANAQFNQGSNENLDGFHAKQEFQQTDGSVGYRLFKGQKDNYNFYYLGLRYSF